jgi:hypothetical protein
MRAGVTECERGRRECSCSCSCDDGPQPLPHASTTISQYSVMDTVSDSIDNRAGGSYNMSFGYKLAGHLLRFPSRMLSRLRNLDEVLDQPPLGQASADSVGDSLGAQARVQQRMRDSGVTPMPAAWGFLTSGYFFGLFFMVSRLSWKSRLMLTMIRLFF